MTTDDEMKIDYAVVLKQLQDELGGMDERRQALLASIAAIRRLVDDEPEQAFPATPDAPVRMPPIPPRFFAGMTPTAAYRELMERWPGHYRPPQIADLFLAGGMEPPSRTQLLQSIHSVLKRERERAAAEKRRREADVLPIARVR